MALVHDVCEIGADDVCAHHADEAKVAREESYLSSVRALYPEFGEEVMAIWLEYEKQETSESKWVKVIDKLLPFILNLACERRTWREQRITRPMVSEHYRFISEVDQGIYGWMMGELQNATEKGWLLSSL